MQQPGVRSESGGSRLDSASNAGHETSRRHDEHEPSPALTKRLINHAISVWKQGDTAHRRLFEIQTGVRP
jgi:hypothetical protein